MLRRDLLFAFGGGLLAATTAGAALADVRAKHRVHAITQSAAGTTLKLSASNAPFPCEGGAYDDATVFVFVPLQARLSKSKRVDFVVHFHGHNTTAQKAIENHKLREQLRESRQSAVLVVPQGPVNAAESDFGRLMKKGGLSRLLEEVRTSLEQSDVDEALGKASFAGSSAVGRVVVSGHSGGYRPAAFVAQHGGVDVREVYLFDALYGEVDAFASFVEAEASHKLVSYYIGGVPQQNSVKLADKLTQAGVLVKRETGDKRLTREELVKGRACFLAGKASHATATFEEHALRDCLLASCLIGRGSKPWHKAGKQARSS